MEDFNFDINLNDKKLRTNVTTMDSLSKRVLGLDWFTHLPKTFLKDKNGEAKEFTFVPCSYHDGKEFLEANSETLFNDTVYNNNFAMLDSFKNKESFYHHCVDNFALYCDGRMVGYASINLQDWSTYYLRYINVLPEYRGHKVIVNIVEFIIDTIQAYGITRVQADVSVNNHSQLAKHVRMGFLVTGNTQCERWGSMVHLTKLLDEKANAVFSKQYCLST